VLQIFALDLFDDHEGFRLLIKEDCKSARSVDQDLPHLSQRDTVSLKRKTQQCFSGPFYLHERQSSMADGLMPKQALSLIYDPEML